MSLKTRIIPALADALAVTPAALYERQRALLRAGLLHAEPGRGPGSGVHATPESVAMMLISLLATDSVSEAGSQTKNFVNLRSAAKAKRCPLTGEETFAAAVAAILASEDTAKRVKWIEVSRGERVGGIAYKPRGIERLRPVAIELLSEGRNIPATMSWFGSGGFKSALHVSALLALVFPWLATILKEAKT